MTILILIIFKNSKKLEEVFLWFFFNADAIIFNWNFDFVSMLFNCDRNFTILMIDEFDWVSNQVYEHLFNSRLIRMENDVTE